MEHMLRCNSLKCRTELGDKALVTTCSHIFCTDCAARLGLTNTSGRHSCPACSSPLNNPDDAVVTNLNPSEDYKTSVLSGLSPNVIIECASRALSFWTYQTIQEVVYQEYLGKTLTEKYTNLTIHLEKVISDANNQITALNNKIANLSFDQQSLRRKNDELAQAFREKNKKLMQSQELYDKLKRKAMMGQIQHAAEDAVDSNIHSVIGRGTGSSGLEGETLSSDIRQEPSTTYQQPYNQQSNVIRGSNMYSTQAHIHSNPGAWGKPIGGGEVPLTPSTHRQRIAGVTGIGLSTLTCAVAGPRSPRHALNSRAPLNDMQTNHGSNGKFASVGLSSGLKSSHNGGNFNDFIVPTSRAQATQRPAPAFSSLVRGEQEYRPESVLDNIPSASNTEGPHGGFTSQRP